MHTNATPICKQTGCSIITEQIKLKSHCIADTSTALSLMVSSTLQALLSSLIGIHKRHPCKLQLVHLGYQETPPLVGHLCRFLNLSPGVGPDP